MTPYAVQYNDTFLYQYLFRFNFPILVRYQASETDLFLSL